MPAAFLSQSVDMQKCVRCVLLSILLSPLAWAGPLVIRRVTVIDATGKPAQPGMTVVIEQDQIAAIGPWTKVKAPAGSQIVDGRGKFLIPGLWDMHVHGFSTEPGSTAEERRSVCAHKVRNRKLVYVEMQISKHPQQ
jgi:cytosine/adenosine deaminase-related metal-dependent hydrolase